MKILACKSDSPIRAIAVIAAVVLLGTAASAMAALPAGTFWNSVSSVRLEVDFPGDGYHADWTLYRCECGDLLVHSELSAPGEVQIGELLLVGRRAVLSRGFASDEMASEGSWDAPALMMQLALRLLERTVPAGPADVAEKVSVSAAEEREPIRLDTGSAVGGFPAPWTVEGSVEPVSDTERRFRLHFTFNTGVMVNGEYERGAIRLNGLADYAEAGFPLADDMELNGWTLSWRNPGDSAASGGGAMGTLADLRARINANPD